MASCSPVTGTCTSPARDPRYLRRNALIALGNAGGDEARALAEPFAVGGDPVLAPPARRVLES